MFFDIPREMPKRKCEVCGQIKPIAEVLKVCRDCIINNFEKAKKYIDAAHYRARIRYNLPLHPPKNPKGILCNLCSNQCKIGKDEVGYCGLRYNENGKLIQFATPNKALAYAYLDPHVTNCCLAWICPAGTGLGYPKFAVRPRPEYGYYNLAVFFYGCNFSCLYCQNWEHKDLSRANRISAEELAEVVLRNRKITCICYFGGSPEPHLPFTIRVNDIILREKGNRIIRICYEWNGAGNKYLVRRVGEQVLQSGGIIKFDLKAPNSKLNYALSGVPNDAVFDNFKMLYDEFWHERPEVPILGATTLLVPGYIMPEDVEEIAKFIASVDPEIPYSLLIFHPDFMMRDLPVTPRKIVFESYERARKYLKRVHIGNKFLLSVAPESL